MAKNRTGTGTTDTGTSTGTAATGGRMNSTLLSVGLEPKPGDQDKGGKIGRATEGFKAEEDKATERVTAYFTPAQFDAIEDLQKAYRQRMKKRITVNALLRLIVENITIDDILR